MGVPLADFEFEFRGGQSSSRSRRTPSKRQQQLSLLMVDETDLGVPLADFEFEFRDKMLLCFDDPHFHPGAKVLSLFIMGLIVLSIVAICAETVEDLAEEYKDELMWTEHICVFAFTAEYVCRFCCSRKKWRFARQYLNPV